LKEEVAFQQQFGQQQQQASGGPGNHPKNEN
jgi:hypothetical protein